MVKYKEMAMQTLAGLPTNMPVARVEFDYDYMSRRVGKTVYNWGSNGWQEVSSAVFLYDAWNLISEQTHKQTSAKTNFFTFGLDLSGTLQGAGGIGGLVSAVLGTNAVCYTYDANGNVSELINCAGGANLSHYEYSPFGETIIATGELAKSNPFRFSAKYTDDETSLVYYGYRFYSPELGRWINRDPIEEWGGLNLYGFLLNSPVNYWDYLGLCDCDAEVKAVKRAQKQVTAAGIAVVAACAAAKTGIGAIACLAALYALDVATDALADAAQALADCIKRIENDPGCQCED